MTHPIWVEYWPEHSTHNHLLLLSDGTISHSELLADIEACAEELAEQVRRCNDDRHDGHGQAHSHEEIEKAHKMAVYQLFSRDYAADWEEIERGIRAWKKWKGPVPAAIIQMSADDPKKEELLITDSEGNLYKRDIIQDVLRDVLPPPQEFGGRPNKLGLGWTMPPKER